MESLTLQKTSKVKTNLLLNPTIPTRLSPSATSTCFLNTSGDGDFTSLFQCLTHSSSEEIFPTIQPAPHNAAWGHFLLLLGRRDWSHVATSSFQGVAESLLFSRLNTPSCSSEDLPSRPFTSSLALLWTQNTWHHFGLKGTPQAAFCHKSPRRTFCSIRNKGHAFSSYTFLKLLNKPVLLPCCKGVLIPRFKPGASLILSVTFP